jgi:hypothetical protein
MQRAVDPSAFMSLASCAVEASNQDPLVLRPPQALPTQGLAYRMPLAHSPGELAQFAVNPTARVYLGLKSKQDSSTLDCPN